MIVQEQLPKEEDVKAKVKAALISNHKHVTEKKRGTSLKSEVDFLYNFTWYEIVHEIWI